MELLNKYILFFTSQRDSISCKFLQRPLIYITPVRILTHLKLYLRIWSSPVHLCSWPHLLLSSPRIYCINYFFLFSTLLLPWLYSLVASLQLSFLLQSWFKMMLLPLLHIFLLFPHILKSLSFAKITGHLGGDNSNIHLLFFFLVWSLYQLWRWWLIVNSCWINLIFEFYCISLLCFREDLGL